MVKKNKSSVEFPPTSKLFARMRHINNVTINQILPPLPPLDLASNEVQLLVTFLDKLISNVPKDPVQYIDVAEGKVCAS